MVMMMALALAAQTGPDTAEANRALKCAQAVLTVAPTDDETAVLKMTSQYLYFVMVAARADPGDGGMLERIGEMTNRTAGMAQPSQSEARKLLPECLRAYPLARMDVPVKLPANPYDRDITCHIAVRMTYGASEGKNGVTALEANLARLEPAMTFYDSRAATLFKQKGFDGKASDNERVRYIAGSLVYGNLYSLADACIALMPK